MRFDVVLHALRLFKSRSQALAAIDDRRALLNGQPVKPGHAVRPGDWITLARADRARTIEILELPQGSLSKEQARHLVRAVRAT